MITDLSVAAYRSRGSCHYFPLMQTRQKIARHRSFIIFSSITLSGLCTVNFRLAADLDRSLSVYNSVTSPPFYNNAPSYNNSTKNLVVEHFHQAIGLELDDETVQRLPTWSQIESLIGNKPVFIGLERCNDFRNNVPPLRRMLGSSGMFNSGTNLVSHMQYEIYAFSMKYMRFFDKFNALCAQHYFRLHDS